MSKKFLYGLIAALLVPLALFIGLYMGVKDKNEVKEDYKAPAVIDRTDTVVDPDLGLVEDGTLEGEIYYLKPNNLISENAEYYVNNNGDISKGKEYYNSLFSSTYLGDVSEESFITVEKFTDDISDSQLVYIKFSTYLGEYNSSGKLTKTEPAAVVFGYELTPENELILRYSLATYGDRGPVTSYQQMMTNKDGAVIGNNISVRTPYLLTANYEDVVKLFKNEGLLVGDTTYKLLNNGTEQISIKSDVLTTISALLTYVLNNNQNAKMNTQYYDNYNLKDYFVIEGQTEDSNILSVVGYAKGIVDITGENLNYFDTYKMSSWVIYPSVYSWFNNANAIYNIPLVNVEA